MKSVFIINDIVYTVAKVTAISGYDLDRENPEDYRQEALFVYSKLNGEETEYVVFGWEMPDDCEGFEEMCEDGISWESQSEVIESVEFNL